MDPIIEVVALILGFLGWVMVGIAIPNRYWKTSTIDGSVITTSTIYENLWMSCASDATGVHNCREFPSLLALNGRTLGWYRQLGWYNSDRAWQIVWFRKANWLKSISNSNEEEFNFTLFFVVWNYNGLITSSKKCLKFSNVFFFGRLHSGLTCIDDRLSCYGDIWDGLHVNRDAMFQSRRRQPRSKGQNCRHWRSLVPPSR